MAWLLVIVMYVSTPKGEEHINTIKIPQANYEECKENKGMQGINIHWFGLGVKFDSYCIVGFGDNQFKGGEFKDFAHSYKGDLEKKD